MPLTDGTPEDYAGAALRHFSDARTLKDAGRIDNAGHLIGFAAECAIKHRVGELTNDSLKLHLPELIQAARKRLGSRIGYASMHSLLKGDVLTCWAVDHRYALTGLVSEERFLVWQQTTKRLFAAAGLKMREQ
ncbi:hypothetical protein [Methylorubrum extorquens]